jgi:hypothetical protein
MTEEDLERIRASQRRAALGCMTALDAWILRRANDTRRNDDNVKLDITPEARLALIDEWFDERFQELSQRDVIPVVGDVLGETRAELRAEIDKLRTELAELRTEQLRTNTGGVIKLPNWRRGDAA